MAGGGSSESHSTDMTPQAFQGLQGPYASVIGNLLGFQLRNANGAVNPVNFGYPAGQLSTGSGTPGGTGGGQTGGGGGGGNGQQGNWVPYQSRSPTSTADTGGYYANGGAGGRNGGSGGASNPMGGMYLSNPNLGTGNPNDILNGMPHYQGPLTAGMNGNEGQILGQLQANGSPYGVGGSTDNMTNAFLQGQMAGNYLPGQNPSLQGFSQNYQSAQPQYNASTYNPFLSSAITAAQTPTMQNLQETLGQGLPSQFAAAGQHVQPGASSAFDRAGDIAVRGATQEMGNIASTMSNQFYGQQQAQQAASDMQNNAQTGQAMQTELSNEFAGGQNAQNRQLQAAQVAPTATSTQVSNMVQNLQAQALPRLIQQYGIENGMSQFNNQVNSLLSTLGIAGGVTKPTVGQSSSSQQKPNLLPLAGM
jgi:uncharacterized membrane protein